MFHEFIWNEASLVFLYHTMIVLWSIPAISHEVKFHFKEKLSVSGKYDLIDNMGEIKLCKHNYTSEIEMLDDTTPSSIDTERNN